MNGGSNDVRVVGVYVGAPEASCSTNLLDTAGDGSPLILGRAERPEVSTRDSDSEGTVFLALEIRNRLNLTAEVEFCIERG